MTPWTAAAAAALVGVGATLPVGGRAFAVAVVLAAGVAVVMLDAALATAGPRPVVVASAIAAVGTPLRLLFQPEAGLAVLPTFVAATVLGGFLLLIVSARRTGITAALGATLFTGLLIGLGGGSLLILRGMQHGLAWTLAVLLLSLVPEAAALASQRLRPSDATVSQAVRIVALVVVAGGLVAAADPPMTAAVAAAVLVICAGAAYASGLVQQAVSDESEQPPSAAPGVRWFTVVLLAAPATLLLATTVQN